MSWAGWGRAVFKVDLHTHSVASADGGLRASDYRLMLDGRLDCVAITDHNTIDFARQLQAELGDKIIIGEEISTQEGELIGLYLHKAVPPGLTAAKTAAAIRKQGGLVYVPHPFETARQGLSAEVLEQIAEQVDIIETHNGRAVFQNRGLQALQWAQEHTIPGAASSDAHGRHGWGRTYTTVEQLPLRSNLVKLLGLARYSRRFVGARGLAYPKLNRLRKKVRHG